MAKVIKDTTPRDPRALWKCEGCWDVHEGVNPPDECHCGHQHFENLKDLQDEATASLYAGAVH
jgi:hypothetical protein